MCKLTYEQRMALYDVLAELKTGIDCEECGNRTYIDDMCIRSQVDELQSLYDDAVKMAMQNATYTLTGEFNGENFAEITLLPAYVYITSRITNIEITSLRKRYPDGVLLPWHGHGLLDIYIHKSNDVLGNPVAVLQHNGTKTERPTSIVVEKGNCVTFRMSDMDRRFFRVDLILEVI